MPPVDGVQAALRRAQDFADTGRIAAAIAQLRQAVLSAPGDPRPWRALALLQMQAGDHGAAVEAMRRAHQCAPDQGELAEQYGSLLAYMGAIKEAIAPLERATSLLPSRASSWYLLGLARLRIGQALEALAPLRRAHALDGADPRTRMALAEAEFVAGFPEDALPLLRTLHQDDPANLDIILKLGETLSRLGERDAALAHYAAALQQGGSAADLHMAMAQAYEDTGDRDSAARAYRSALQLRPDWAFPLAGLLDVLRGSAGDELLADTRRLLAASATSDADRALLGYALGKAEDARGQYVQAMAAWTIANDARRRVVGLYDAARLSTLRDRVIAATSSGDAAREAKDAHAVRPVFIVGMPRSGTTLTEQILASHPQVHGCGELPHIALIARHLPLMTDSATPWPEIVRHLPDDVVAAARNRYLQAALRHAPAGALRLIDKSPLNFFQLDLVARMFPEALVIWCRRDPRDVAVSIYAENFSLEESFATGMASIGHFIDIQAQLMRHWQAHSPLPIHTLDYEALVQDLEKEARQLIDFVGLPWDTACLDFHNNARGVQTPSRWQVKQPAHTRSIGRWRHYADTIKPVFDDLQSEGGD